MSNIYSISKFAKRTGVSVSTLRRWDESGKFNAERRDSGHRFYTEAHVRELLHITPLDERKTVVYCRVSSSNQKDDLESQVEAMETFCLNGGIAVDSLIEEVGGGMNFKRKKFLSLMNDVIDGKVSHLYVAHKDRLCRFGFELVEWVCSKAGCELVVVNQKSMSPQSEMVEDLMAIIHTFSCRLYGLRSYKKKLKEAASQ